MLRRPADAPYDARLELRPARARCAAALRSVGVLPGLDAAAAEVVCGGDARFLDGLEALVDEELVRQRESADAEPRFSMLEIVRSTHSNDCRLRAKTTRLARRHLETSSPCRGGRAKARPPRPIAGSVRLEDEHDNFVLHSPSLSRPRTRLQRCGSSSDTDGSGKSTATSRGPRGSRVRAGRCSPYAVGSARERTQHDGSLAGSRAVRCRAVRSSGLRSKTPPCGRSDSPRSRPRSSTSANMAFYSGTRYGARPLQGHRNCRLGLETMRGLSIVAKGAAVMRAGSPGTDAEMCRKR